MKIKIHHEKDDGRQEDHEEHQDPGRDEIKKTNRAAKKEQLCHDHTHKGPKAHLPASIKPNAIAKNNEEGEEYEDESCHANFPLSQKDIRRYTVGEKKQ